MQHNLLSPALPSSPTEILKTSSPQPLPPPVHPDSAMTTTITTTTTTVKRKRADIPDSASVTKPVVKKKKANRACIHCQKAHLTCDDCPSYVPILCPKFFRVCSQRDLSFFPQQDPVNAASSVVCQVTVSRATERRPNTSSTTKSWVRIRFPYISPTGDLIVSPTPHRSSPTRKERETWKRRQQLS